MPIKHIPAYRKWFLYAVALFCVFALFSALLASGVLLYPTLYIEQWLMHRPLTGVDCVFLEWKQLGEASVSLFFTLLLGLGCVFLRYRFRVLPYLLFICLIGIGVEYVGKQYFPQPVPVNEQVGIDTLSCPQMRNYPRSVKLQVALGMWWKAPTPRPWLKRREQYSTTAPLIFDEDTSIGYGYPSGHALRWSFIGLILSWLVWRHVKYRWLRIFLLAIAIALAFGGGFAQFYIGLHLSTDVIGGYLVGFGSACCAIGLLLRNEKPRATAVLAGTSDELSPVLEGSTEG